MAATNFTPIILYHSVTASAAPTAGNLNNGELAINITDGKLFYKDNGGVVQIIATKGTGVIGGSNNQVQYNSSGALAGSANFTFDGTTATINTLNLTTVLDETYGGTGLTSYTTGDVIYASGSNTLAKLAIGANTYILTSTGSVPQWSAPSAVSVSTATNLAGGTAGAVPYQSGAGATTFLSIGTSNQVLTSTGSAPQWVSGLSLTTLSTSGNTTLGDAAADNLTINATVTSNLIFTDNTYDIGANGATRPRTIYVGTSVFSPLVDTTNLEVTNIKALDGTAALSIADSTGAVTVATALTANGGAVFNENGADVDFRVEGDTDANLIFADASTDRVGIGTNSPVYKLTTNVTGGSATALFKTDQSTADIYLQASGTSQTYSVGIGASGNGLRFLSNAASNMLLDSSGNLGLGVTPSAWYSTGYSALQVRGSSLYGTTGNDTNLASNAFVNTSPAWAYVSTGTATRYEQGGGTHKWYNAPSGTANSASVTSGASYTVVALGSSTLAQWQAFFNDSSNNPLTVTPTLGQVLTGNATGTLLGGGLVTQNISFTQAMTLLANGNLGVGETSPQRRIHGYIATGPVARMQTNGSNAAIEYVPGATDGTGSIYNWVVGAQYNVGNAFEITPSTAAGGLTFSTPALVVTSGGNVGIGTNNPGYKLDVNGTFGLGTGQTGNVGVFGANTATADTYFRLRNTAGAFDIGTAASGHYLYGQGSLPLRFFTDATERARITSVGGFETRPAATGHAVFNEDGVDADFRVESDSSTHALFVDAGNDVVILGNSASGAASGTRLSVAGKTSIGNRATQQSYSLELSGLSVSDGSGNYGSYGGLYFFATAEFTGSARQYLLTNGYQTNNFAIIRGDTSPATQPTLGTSGAVVDGKVFLSIDDSNELVINEDGNDIDFRVESDLDTHCLFVDASANNVGIGTNAPGAKLDVRGPATDFAGLNVINTEGSSGVVTTSSIRLGITNSIGVRNTRITAIERTADSNDVSLAFFTNDANALNAEVERARITSDGYVKASDNGSYAGLGAAFHEFNQSIAGQGALVLYGLNASTTAAGMLYIETARNTTNNTYYAISYYNTGAAAYKFRVADSGDVTNTNGTYGSISDAKMKTDIVDAGSQWSDIKALRFRKFKMKDDPSGLVQLGVVAQEVELTSPGLVDEHPDMETVEVTDEDGNVTQTQQPTGTTTKSVKTSILLMKAAVALQEAMARIEKLEAEVAALKGA